MWDVEDMLAKDFNKIIYLISVERQKAQKLYIKLETCHERSGVATVYFSPLPPPPQAVYNVWALSLWKEMLQTDQLL